MCSAAIFVWDLLQEQTWAIQLCEVVASGSHIFFSVLLNLPFWMRALHICPIWFPTLLKWKVSREYSSNYRHLFIVICLTFVSKWFHLAQDHCQASGSGLYCDNAHWKFRAIIQYVTFGLGHSKSCSVMGQVFNLSCEGRLCFRDSDAGADVFLPSSPQYYNVLWVTEVF